MLIPNRELYHSFQKDRKQSYPNRSRRTESGDYSYFHRFDLICRVNIFTDKMYTLYKIIKQVSINNFYGLCEQWDRLLICTTIYRQ